MEKQKITAAIILKDSDIVIPAKGFGFEGEAVGEIVFNTGMIGYQETLTDPSYRSQIITFSFPHIGNTGINKEDYRSKEICARGMIVREKPTAPSNWRAEQDFTAWLKEKEVIALCHVDTRTLLKRIRHEKGGLYGIIAYNEKGLDLEKLREQLAGREGTHAKKK